MRITGGTSRGRTLFAPDGMNTRPTADRVREALFNILSHHDWGEAIGNPLNGATVLDAFAGTGALGIEALSRGAARCIFFENDRKALESLRRNAMLCAKEQITLLPVDVTKAPTATHQASLLFLDPPYHKGLIEKAITSLSKQGWIAPHALLVCETAKNETLTLPDGYEELLLRFYGDTAIRFIATQS